MMPRFYWCRSVPLVCGLMMTSCAASRPTLPVALPRLSLPETATRPCAIATLPVSPTQADLEVAYMTRGAQIVACDAARRLLLDTIATERQLQDRQPEGG